MRTAKNDENSLLERLRDSIGPAWLKSQLAAPPEHRHPIGEWYRLTQALLEDPPELRLESSGIHGSLAACYSLASDLYTLQSHRRLQSSLIERLKDHVEFSTTRYEIYVAAAFIRAGFTMDFESDESPLTRHCEFTATCSRTGRRFSVEAKRRASKPDELRMVSLFTVALAKQARYRRIIFLDWNRRYEAAQGNDLPHHVRDYLRRLRALEGKTFPLAVSNQSAYVFLTNTPWELYLESMLPPFSLQVVGFQVPDFPEESAWVQHADEPNSPHFEICQLKRSLGHAWEAIFTVEGELNSEPVDPDRQSMTAII